ncbi:hypothetical protein [Marinicella meishanensis]|uniref:hypothetical protein n=1 Tax=Marinicella meishanensis TaxID=2873263 RepID=UPI001CBF035C|nr:hypothetical protein [Marinicella sp. NBU2979]
MFSERLINELGLISLRLKQPVPHNAHDLLDRLSDETPTASETATETAPKLDKNEFRLLVKMLQAIGHDCQYDAMTYDGSVVTYQHPKKTLVFDDIKRADDAQIMNLTRLADLLLDDSLKRPVWEKLKSLR